MSLDSIEIDIKNNFEINQKLNIKRIYADDESQYNSYVKDMGKDYILIEKLIKNNVPISLHKNSSINLFLLKKDCVLQGKSIVYDIDHSRVGGVWVTYPDVLEKIQRRDFIRLGIPFLVKFVYLSGDKMGQELKLQCVNISGGGIALYSKEKLLTEYQIGVEFILEDISICSRVKFIHAQYDIHEKKYLSGLKFLEVSPKVMNDIHKCVIKNQIDFRRKGLI